MIWAGHIALMEGNILVTKPKGKRPPGRPMHNENSRMDLRETGWEGMD
jgi:hypothetical protein